MLNFVVLQNYFTNHTIAKQDTLIKKHLLRIKKIYSLLTQEAKFLSSS